MSEFDPGPPEHLAAMFDRVPDPPVKEDFWFDWGPIFYRGRLDGSARVLCVASDPGPTERIAGRSLIGDAGQRVQGFLTKIGLTRSYVCLNAWAYAVHPSRASTERRKLADPDQLSWRNELYDTVATPELQAIVAFGGMAQAAVDLWSERPDVKVCRVPHPSSRDEAALTDEWRAAVSDLREIVTPDPDGDVAGPNYGNEHRGRLLADPANRPAVRRSAVSRRRCRGSCRARQCAQLGRSPSARRRSHADLDRSHDRAVAR